MSLTMQNATRCLRPLRPMRLVQTWHRYYRFLIKKPPAADRPADAVDRCAFCSRRPQLRGAHRTSAATGTFSFAVRSDHNGAATVSGSNSCDTAVGLTQKSWNHAAQSWLFCVSMTQMLRMQILKSRTVKQKAPSLMEYVNRNCCILLRPLHSAAQKHGACVRDYGHQGGGSGTADQVRNCSVSAFWA
jgi:hypothetical protein